MSGNYEKMFIVSFNDEHMKHFRKFNRAVVENFLKLYGRRVTNKKALAMLRCIE
jgi:hypothetical protein